MQKVCTKCKLNTNQFYNRSDSKNKLRSWCISCIKIEKKKADKIRYNQNKEKILMSSLRTPRGKFTRYKQSAKKRNIEFSLSFEEFNRMRVRKMRQANREREQQEDLEYYKNHPNE